MKTKEGFKEDLKAIFEKILKEKNISQTQFAKEIGQTQATLNTKIRNASMRYTEAAELLDYLGYEIIVVKKDKTQRTQAEKDFLLQKLFTLSDVLANEWVSDYVAGVAEKRLKK